MFQELSNQVWSGTANIFDNTDFSIDGSSKKCIFSAIGQYVDITFDIITLSEYEELSLYLYTTPRLPKENLLTLSIDGNDITLEAMNKNCYFEHILVDCSSMGAVNTIRFISLVSSLTLFIDYIGVRKVSYKNLDISLLQALQDHISLDYGVETTLSSDIAAESKTIDLNSWSYVNNNTELLIDNTEIVRLINKGELSEGVASAYSSGTSVKINLPVCLEDMIDIAPDPMIGICLIDVDTDSYRTIEYSKNISKNKKHLGNAVINIFLESSSKLKLLQLAREYNNVYGSSFVFLHDGECTNMYIESVLFIDDEIGNIPRIVYTYKIQVSPITVSKRYPITDLTLNIKASEV